MALQLFVMMIIF